MTLKPLTGLFLGAGASYEAGMPLVWELTAEIKNWLNADKIRELNAGWRIQGGGYSDGVVNDLISILECPAAHYESVLGYMEVQFRPQRSQSQEYYGLYSWLVELVSHLLYLRHVNNLACIGRALPFYDGIRALAEANAPLWIFSLNHDVIVEAIAAHLSIPLHSGFSPSVVTLPRLNLIGNKKGEIRAEVLTKHDLEHHAMYFPNPFQAGIYLLKIHGALDVFTFNNGEDLLRLLPTGSGYEGVIDALRAANEDLFFPIPGAFGGSRKLRISRFHLRLAVVAHSSVLRQSTRSYSSNECSAGGAPLPLVAPCCLRIDYEGARCPYCFRHPYRVTPGGLYTESTKGTSNTSRPPAA
jgi:hypothetical protein